MPLNLDEPHYHCPACKKNLYTVGHDGEKYCLTCEKAVSNVFDTKMILCTPFICASS